jgi:iron complex outermembrane receptor protein
MTMVRKAIRTALVLALATQAAPGARAQETSAESPALEEVVVTARKRAEDLQAVPIAASAFTTADLERQQAFGLEDLHLSVPNMTITRNNTGSNGAQIYIRGIGRDNSTWNEESGVGVYVDDVYFSQQIGSLLDFIEYERIEVLRGPQGTLYGRNATSGAVKFVVSRPSFDGVTAVGDITVGSFNRLDVRGSISSEIVDDRLAVKFDVVSRTDDGYVRRPSTSTFGPDERLNGTNRQTARVALLQRVSEQTDVYFTAAASYGRDDINTPIPIADPDLDGVYVPRYGSRYVADPGIRNDTRFESYFANLQVSHDFGPATLKSITAYRTVEDELRGDLDGWFPVPIDFDQITEFDTISQEFQLNGAVGERLQYVAGLYFFRESLNANSLNVFLGNLRTFSDQTLTSYAGYFDGSYRLLDQLSLSLGLRYTQDEKDVTQSAQLPNGTYRFQEVSGNRSWSELSPRVALDYTITPDVMVYASWAEGFKSGAVIGGRPATADVAADFTDPETASTVEMGVKSQWWDNRLRLNLAAFHTDYENQQASFRDPVTNTMNVVAADAKIRGIELEGVAQLTDGLRLTLTAGWLDSEYENVEPGHPAYGLDVPLKQIPKWAYQTALEYRLPVGNAGDLVFGATYLSSAEIPRDVNNNPIVTTPPYQTLDAQVGFDSSDGRFRIALASENLTGEEYWTMGTAPFSRFYAPEKVWSVSARYRFD